MAKDDDLIICRCEEVTKGDILRAIEDGALTIDGVKKRTRAGMGLCQGKTCQRLVAKILSEATGKSMEEILPSTSRAPVRPVALTAFLGGDDDE